jgi:hypothetical protein
VDNNLLVDFLYSIINIKAFLHLNKNMLLKILKFIVQPKTWKGRREKGQSYHHPSKSQRVTADHL